jgi:hypothetical protein
MLKYVLHDWSDPGNKTRSSMPRDFLTLGRIIMEELILDQLEWLLAQNSGGSRYDRQIITLVGFLSNENMPENIAQQMRALSRQSMLRDIFDALVETMNTFAQNRMRPSPCVR